MYMYISKLEEPVSDNLEIVKHCISLKKKLEQYDELKSKYLELQKLAAKAKEKKQRLD